MEAYEEAIERTSTDDAPWYVIPADKKWYRDLVISQIIVDTLKELNMQFPKPARSEERRLTDVREPNNANRECHVSSVVVLGLSPEIGALHQVAAAREGAPDANLTTAIEATRTH